MQIETKISQLNLGNSTKLARILKEDKELIKTLSGEPFSGSGKDFLENIRLWQEKTNSNSWAIVADDRPIGLISLSHQKNRTARIGYWISSSFWGRGCASRAFNLVVQKAKELQMSKVSCTIDPANLASKKIWQNHGALIDKTGEAQLRATILL